MNFIRSIIAIVGIVFYILNPLSAFAHAHLVKSEPAQNEAQQEAPKTITLHFSEALELAMCKLEVKEVETDKSVSEGKVTTGEDRQTLQVNVKPFKDQKKRSLEVTWRAVAKDTHKINGKFLISIDPDSKKEKIIECLSRWVFYTVLTISSRIC